MSEINAGRQQVLGRDPPDRILPTRYDGQILQLQLPEQDALKNAAERCSADPRALNALGRAVGQQVRITRKDDPRFFALYTVKEANPPADLNDPARATVLRTGLLGRERLGKTTAMKAVVRAEVVDLPPLPDEPNEVRFFEAAEDDGTQLYLIVIAPHGGAIEPHTDEEAALVRKELVAKGCGASAWVCKGFGDALMGASDRWHITSTDIHPASFPLLQRLMARRFRHGVAFHGFAKKPDEADVYIGGGASEFIKAEIKNALEGLSLPIEVRIATTTDDPKFQGSSPDNLVNRLAAQGIHIEQSAPARQFAVAIANAIVMVYAPAEEGA
jgi:phage replication-related protein YjqB (UPF0714/DUF867 family)